MTTVDSGKEMNNIEYSLANMGIQMYCYLSHANNLVCFYYVASMR